MMKNILKYLPYLCILTCFSQTCLRQAKHVEPVPDAARRDITLIRPAPFQRGMWVRAVAIASPDSIKRIMQVAHEMNITDLYVQVVVAGYAYYESSILPRSQYLAEVSGPVYDPLDSLLKIARQRSLRVHAWVNALLLWSLENPPDSAGHVFHTHPEWLIKDVHGRSMREYSTEEWLNAGLEGLYLDPGHQEVQRYVARICGEIAEKYPVAGVHLDFIRYPGAVWGTPQTDTSALLAGLEGHKMRWLTLARYPTLPLIWRWMVWHTWHFNRQREKNIQDIVALTRQAVTTSAQYPECMLTAAVFGDPGSARYRYDQNWLAWNNAIDYPLIMSYTKDMMTFKKLLDFGLSHRPEAVFGIGMIWDGMEQEAPVQTELVRQQQGAGICYFDFTNLDTMYDRTLLMEKNNAEIGIHLVPDTATVINIDAFTDKVPGPIYRMVKPDTTDEDKAFARYLLSLSLSGVQDLQRMGISQDDFLQYITQDVLCFRSLDAHVLTGFKTLIEPPRRHVQFEFLPWGDMDTAMVKEKARKINVFTQERKVYPKCLDHLAHAAFSSDIDEQGTWSIRTGIYAFRVIQEDPGGAPVSRDKIPPDLLPVYIAWTVHEKAQEFIAYQKTR